MQYLPDRNGKVFDSEQTEPRIPLVRPKQNTPGKMLQRFRERFQVYRVNFRLWRLRRPFWGAILMILASMLILSGPFSLLRFALLPGSTLWAGLLVGALLLVMGLIQLFAPVFSTITGAVGIVLSLVSIIVALGGLVIGMFLGIIGGALGIAWRPNARTFASATRKKRSRLLARPRLSKNGS